MSINQEPQRPRSARSRTRSMARRRSSGDMVWNVLTVLVWLGMASLVMVFATIYIDPQSRMNPFRASPTVQPTALAAVTAITIPTETATVAVTPTATIRVPKATRTPTPTQTPVTPTPTETPAPPATETATPGPSPTKTIVSAYPYVLRGDPVQLPSSTFPDHEACFLWVAGQTYDLQGAPMVGITVMLGGRLDGRNMYQLSLTGTALQFGQAGYEFLLAEQPTASRQALWVQLFDQAMIPLSGKMYFDTSDDCAKNLVLVNFKQIR